MPEEPITCDKEMFEAQQLLCHEVCEFVSFRFLDVLEGCKGAIANSDNEHSSGHVVLADPSFLRHVYVASFPS